jgi:hypothetical protein
LSALAQRVFSSHAITGSLDKLESIVPGQTLLQYLLTGFASGNGILVSALCD